jgi:hypothetical protein
MHHGIEQFHLLRADGENQVLANHALVSIKKHRNAGKHGNAGCGVADRLVQRQRHGHGSEVGDFQRD